MPRLYALILKPSQSIPFVPPPDGQLWYLRHAALAAGGSFEDHATLSFKTSDGPEVSLGTLRRDRDYMNLDLPLGEYVEFKATGNVEIHLTGHLVDDDELMEDDEDLEDLEGMKAALMNGGDKGMQMMMALQDSEESDEDPIDTSPVVEEVTPETSNEKAKRKAPPVTSPVSKTPDQRVEKKGKTDNATSQEKPTSPEGDDKPMSKSAAKRLKKKQRREAEAKAQADGKPVVQPDVASPGLLSTDLRSPDALPKTGERKKKRIRRFSNGFVIENLSYGSQEGPTVQPGVKVSIKYLGKLENGTVFDRSEDTVFTYKYGAGEVVRGLDKGLDDMQVGDKRKLTVPSKMGYGSQGAPPAIPPDSTLYFDIELVKIES